MKITLKILLVILCFCLTSIILNACSGGNAPLQTSSPLQQNSASPAATPASASASIGNSPEDSAAPTKTTPPAEAPTINPGGIIYQNSEYGFDFDLPKDWDGYTVIPENWEGHSTAEDQKIVATGPIILIRNPKWTGAEPMQDIPIMVLTLEQWTALQREEFAVSAAPVGPSELGRNSKFVFALPARYNFSYLTGYEKVEDIMNNNPLRAYDRAK